MESRFAAGLASRARLVGAAAAIGFVAGALAVVVLLLEGTVVFASRKSFAVGALLLGFGLLGWSGSVFASGGFEAMQTHLGVSRGWTERKSRRAMARVAGVGGGWMTGASVATVAVT